MTGMNRTQSTSARIHAAGAAPRPINSGMSISAGRRLGSCFTYVLLTTLGLVMIFPMFWMFTASFKPQWQILTQPPIWIPSEWQQAAAGATTQEFPLWYATDPAGERLEVIKVGVRRFTNIIDSSGLPELMSVARDSLTDAQPTQINGLTLNVRTWTQPDGSSEPVVALARDGDNLVVVSAEALAAVTRQIPLDEVNAGKRANVEVSGYNLQTRELADGSAVIAMGPESEQTVVAPKAIAAQAILVPSDAPSNPEPAPFGGTLLPIYSLPDQPADRRFVLLSTESWQPIIGIDEARQFGFTVKPDQLAGNSRIQTFNFASMPVNSVTLENGKQQEVVVLVKETQKVFVIPIENTTTLRLTPLSKLALPFVQNINGMPIRYRDDYEEDGERQSIAVVGDRRDMALVVPRESVTEAFDVPTSSLSPVLTIRFHYQNYIDSLSKDLGGATFVTFFRNSGLLVVLNMIGHFFSVTIVSYAFARLRAPGKNFLFVILLSTMMLPFPVLLIPTFEIFQKMGMINTLWPLFIRSFFGNAFLIFLLRQFFMSIPRELEDAARIDGASTLQVLRYVMLPLSKPALATIGIFTFWWTWNSFFEPYVYLSSVSNFTVSLGLGFFKNQYTTSYHLLMSASMVVILPIILIFFFAQRYFIEGIQLTGLKG